MKSINPSGFLNEEPANLNKESVNLNKGSANSINRKSQLKGAETVLALVFIIIMIILIGSILFRSSINRMSKEINQKNVIYLKDRITRLINLPDIRCPEYGKLCIDSAKVLAVKEVAKTDPNYWNFLRKSLGADVNLTLVSIFPSSYNIVFFNSSPLDFSKSYMFRIPVIIENQTNNPEIGFGYVEVKAFAR